MATARVAGPRIDVEEAKALVDSGEAVVLDVVASHVWPSMSRTIYGSIRIPPEEIQDRCGELPRDKTIITYCTWPDEFTSARVASFLKKQGFEAFALKGGYMAWLKAGYPIDRKEATKAMSLQMVCPECGEPLSNHIDHEQ